MNIERIKTVRGGTRGIKRIKTGVAALAIVFFVFGCAYGYGSGMGGYVGPNALWGALYGASIGAAIGSSSGHTTEGALYGALAGYILGGGLGFGAGMNNYNNQNRYYGNNTQNNPFYPNENPQDKEKYGPYDTNPTPDKNSGTGINYSY
ncbi:MAG: hypothetical protein JW984_10650 [Deltaproteobacteria bacterium]|uniref:Glycine zipper domain-containing protein n=1 Tax=Candidatus Zymogenus saltonus TaxID=2844893 RepID=A0A9D8KH00_9DELT|nr:hypothetical protein [Candidatus Zymogenus saltonus]